MLDLIKIGNFITSLRREKGISQLELAKEMKVSNSAVNKWEQGICLPKKDKINKLIEYFDISLDEFYSGEKNEKNNPPKLKKLSISEKTPILLITISLLILIIMLFIYKNNKTTTYKLLPESSDYVGFGNIFISQKSKIITMTDLSINNESDLSIKSSCFEFFITIEDELILHNGDIKTCIGDNKIKWLKDYIKEIQMNLNNDLNYTIFTSNINNKKLTITINYLNENGEIDKYNMIFDIVRYWKSTKINQNQPKKSSFENKILYTEIERLFGITYNHKFQYIIFLYVAKF